MTGIDSPILHALFGAGKGAMRKRLREVPTGLLLHLTRGMSYLFWGLGTILGLTIVLPRILELKGQVSDSETIFAVTAGVLIVTLGCLFIHSRLVNEIERRLSE